jgi:hypothetical protein
MGTFLCPPESTPSAKQNKLSGLERFVRGCMRRGNPGFCLNNVLCTAILSVVLLHCYGAHASRLGQEVSSSTERVVHVHGIVLDAVTNKPIGRALVTAMDAATMTNGDGTFDCNLRVPSDNAAGGFISGLGGRGPGNGETQVGVIARRPGYLAMQRPSIFVPPGKGSDQPELQIKLIPESILRGRIATPGPTPPMGVQVQLLRKQIQDGRATWTLAGDVATNSHGEYRFADLSASDYKVMTREWLQNGSPIPVADKQIVGYPPAYYPNEADIGSATPIHIGPGETAQADLSLHAEPYFRVSIPVMNAAAGNGISVELEDKSGSSGFSLGFNPQSQMIEGFLPNGAYNVRVTSFGPAQARAAGRIEVAGGPVRGSPISLMPGGSISVIVREEYTADTGGGAPGGPIMAITDRNGNVPSRLLNLMLQPDQANEITSTLRPTSGKGNDDLVVENVWEGKYRLSVMPFRGYVASATAHGVDLLHNLLIVGPTGTSAPIEITLRDDTAWLDGTVSVDESSDGDQGEYGPSLFIFCVPIGNDNGAIVRTAGVVDGKFALQNLAPGRYLVLAYRSFTPQLEYRNEEILREYESKGTIVTLEPGQKAQITVSKVMGDKE